MKVNAVIHKTAASKKMARENRQLLADPRSASGFKSYCKEMVYPIYTDRSEALRNEDRELTAGVEAGRPSTDRNQFRFGKYFRQVAHCISGTTDLYTTSLAKP